jgi:hypothetical protein
VHLVRPANVQLVRSSGDHAGRAGLHDLCLPGFAVCGALYDVRIAVLDMHDGGSVFELFDVRHGAGRR